MTSHRYGITDAITVEGVAQVRASHQVAGAGAVGVLPKLGLIEVGASLSNSSDGKGALLSFSLHRQSRGLSFGLHSELSTPRFRYFGSEKGEQAPAATAQIFSGFDVLGGTAGLSYVRRKNRGRHDEGVAEASYSTQFGRLGNLQLFARRFSGEKTHTAFGAHLTMSLGRGRSASASLDYSLRRPPTGTLSFQQSPKSRHGVGFGAVTLLRDEPNVRANAHFSNSTNDFHAELALGYGSPAARVSAAGAVGIERNVLRVDETDLPMDVVFDEAEVSVRPYARAGTVIHFPLRQERAALLQVKLEDGSYLPAGAVLTRAASDKTYITASNGEVYAPISPANSP